MRRSAWLSGASLIVVTLGLQLGCSEARRPTAVNRSPPPAADAAARPAYEGPAELDAEPIVDETEPQPHVTRSAITPIYDEKADARAQIAAALEVARRDHKRVLVKFGGNWCGWCFKLHDVFHNDPEVAPLIRNEYVVVLVDSNTNADLLRSYGQDNEKHGFPFLTVLDADGQVLVNQNTADLEDGPRHDPAKVRAFLAQWQAERPSAEAAWQAALEEARREDKLVLLYASAPWCGWCHRLADLLAELDPLLSRDYVPLKVDTERMQGGADLVARLRPQDSQGIPWMAIAKPDGRVLITSDGPNGNIGRPASPEEAAHFMAMLGATERRLSEEDLAQIAQAIQLPATEARSP
jgi:thiol-disulfide isomerase/thioredoxin